MKKIFKNFVLMFVAIVVMFSSIGCVGNKLEYNSDEINVNLPKDVSGSVTISTNTLFLNDLKHVTNEFKKVYPNVTVNVKQQSDTSRTIAQWLKADEKKPGVCPDILWFPTVDYQVFANSGVLRDLSPYFAEANKKGTINAADFNSNVLKAGSLTGSNTENLYLLVAQIDSMVSFINKTIFNAAKITVANPGTKDMTFTYAVNGVSKTIVANDWTWTEFEEIAMILSNYYKSIKWGVKPVTSSIQSDSMVLPILDAFGVNYFNEKNEIVFDNEKTRAGLQFIRDMMSSPYTSYAPDSNFVTGNAAIQFQSRPAMSFPKATPGRVFPEPGYYDVTHFDVVPFPKLDIEGVNKPSVGAGGHGYAMYKYSRNPNLAWTFMQFLMTQEGQNALGIGGRHTPVLKSMETNVAESDWNWLKLPERTINHSAFVERKESFVFADFYLSLPFIIQVEVKNIVLEMADNVAKYPDRTIDSEIASCIKKVNNELRKVKA